MFNHLHRIVVLLILALGSAPIHAADTDTSAPADVALIYGSYSGYRDAKLIVNLHLSPHDGRHRIPHHDAGHWLEPADFHQYRVVVFCHLRGEESQAWSDEQIQQAVDYVQAGGHLIFLSNAPYVLAGQGRQISRLEPLLGAKYWGRGSDEGQLLDPAHPIVAHLADEDHAWYRSTGSGTLGQLTTAVALVGTPQHAWVAVNQVGQGQVTYLGHEFFRLQRTAGAAEAFGRAIEAAVLMANPRQLTVSRKLWDPTPLGPDVPIPAFAPAPIRQPLTPRLVVRPASGSPVTLVEQGQPTSVIVLASRPSAAARQGAQALQQGLEKMSGAAVPMVSENDLTVQREGDRLIVTHDGAVVPSVVLVGESELSRSYGFDPETLDYEGYILRTAGNVLIVAGRDLRDHRQHTVGTRHGIFALMERHLGFRWLWPGDSGEVVPAAATVQVGPMDEQDSPAMRYRSFRNSGTGRVVERDGQQVHSNSRYQQGLSRLGQSAADFFSWHQQAGPWFSRQRTGTSMSMQWGHAYEGWWERFGSEHPQWFALQPEARRGREQRPPRERLCVSNVQLAARVAREKIEQYQQSYYQPWQALSISPNDGTASQTFCMCEDCRRLDPPNAPKVRIMYQIAGVRQYVDYPSLTDRYLTFYNRVAEQVASELPDKWVAGYAYSAYRDAPLYTKAHPNLLIGYVGLNYLNDAALERHREGWQRWAAAAHQILLRPNNFHSGHGFPAVYVRKLAWDMARCYETGMVAADFDSALHHWATQGLNYYVLAKLLWDPSLDVEQLVADYCQTGFGPAASHVRDYFEAVETITNQIAAQREPRQQQAADDLDEAEQDWVSVHGGFEARYYMPKTIAALRTHLKQARQAAGGDAAVQQRIDFLEIGLDYAAIQARLRDPELTDAEQGRALMAQRQALAERIFAEHPFAVNVTQLYWREGSFYRQFGYQREPH